jgi:hypothetical protein
MFVTIGGLRGLAAQATLPHKLRMKDLGRAEGYRLCHHCVGAGWSITAPANTNWVAFASALRT